MSAAVQAYVNDPVARGAPLGCWRIDIGTLGRMMVLRGFADFSELMAERDRALSSSNPFNAGSLVSALQMDSYAPFEFLPPIVPGAYGSIYEFRSYRLKPGGLPPTLAGWRPAMPARAKMSRLVMNMYTLDGAPRITHIWPSAGVEECFAIRAKSYQDGIWPPKGGPENILEATSSIALPEPWSPLC